MWFKSETNLATTIGLLETVKQEIKRKLHGQEVSTRLEMSPKRKSVAKAHALFYNGLKEVGGNKVFLLKCVLTPFFVRVDLGASTSG